MTKEDIINNINRLESHYGVYKSKCLRNMRMYTYSPTVTLDLNDSEVVGFFQQGTFDIEDDTTSSIQENVINSCIETLTSKIASQKVRPFFNTVEGTYKEMQIVRQAQIFFDQLYEEHNVARTVVNAFRSACVFDKGIVKVNNEGIFTCLPWNVYIDPKEKSYNKITYIAEKLPKTPGRLVKIKYGITKDVDYNLDYTVYEYYDVMEHVHAVYITELDKVVTEKWDPDTIPYCFIYYSDPIKGNTSQSVVDLLYGIQLQIDEIMSVIKDSVQMNPGMMIFSPRLANVKTGMLSNRTGQIVEYDPIVSGDNVPPVTWATNDIISPQFVQMLDKLKQDAYELVGISQLSATSQKPQGLDSGKALSTMEDIESDRFETQLNAVIRLYVDIAKKCIDVFPPEEDILPDEQTRANIKWADIVEARNMMKIQYSAMNQLSRDPAAKAQQLNMLINMGVIPKSHIAQFFEIPDIYSGYNLVNNAYNAVYTFIDNVVEAGVVPETIPEYLPTEKMGLLETEITNTILSLAKKPQENVLEIELLKQLMMKVQEVQRDSTTNAEMMATQQLSMEMTQAMPQIQQEAANAAQEVMQQPSEIV